MSDRDDFKPTELFSTEAEALATAIYEDNVNSWFEAKRMLVDALQSAYERGRKEERETCNEIVRAAWGANVSIAALEKAAAIMKETGDE